MTRKTVGSIRGKLVLVVDDAEIEIGEVFLPLEVTRVVPHGKSRMALGIGVDLEAVTETVREIFRSQAGADHE